MEQELGSFCWIELSTTDPTATKKFYSNVFGWTGDDIPMGPEMSYTMFRLNGRDVGGAYKLMKEQLDAHVPPHWMLYIRVGNADVAASKALNLGAKQIVPPSDIPHVGRFAALDDPTGAGICIFEPREHRGLTAFGEVGSLCWADLNSRDPEKAAKFYGDWVGWKFEAGTDGYRHILTQAGKEHMIGGIPPQMHAPPGTPSHWMLYFRAADCKQTAAKAAQLGAHTIMPAQLMPNVGTIAVLKDPQGAIFAVYQDVASSGPR